MKSKIQSPGWLLLGAMLMLFSNGRWIIPAATWLYPVCFLHFIRNNSPGYGFSGIAVISAVVNSISWWKMIPVPLPFYFVLTSVFMNVISLAFLADRLIAEKMKGFTSTLVFPLLWCSLEFCTSLLPKGTWSSLAYTQAGNLPLLQLASLTGIWGISFLITWFASVVNWAWSKYFEWEKIRRGAVIFLTVGLTIWLFGLIRMNTFPGGTATVRTASIVNDRNINSDLKTCRWTDAKSIHVFSPEVEENLLSKTRMAAAGGAKIILWQESAGFLPRHEEENFIDSARVLAAREKIYLLMTLWSVPEDFPKRLVENKLIIIDPAGQIRMTYLKNNPAPPEPIKKGDGRLEVLETAFGNIAPAICFDAEFPGFIRQAGQKKAGIFFLPANDWKAIDPIHANMSMLRAIENGFSLVRAAGQGLSVATDNRGNMISSMDYYRTNEQIMYADVPFFHSNTLYTRFGDWFAWFCIVGFMGMLLALVLKNFTGRKPGFTMGEKTDLDLQS